MKHYLIAFAFWAILGGFSSVSAGNIYAVNGVKVDASAANSADARELAMREGQGLAINTVFRRLTLSSYWDQLPSSDELNLDSFVEGFRVADERTSPTRYIAKLSISFKPDAVREALLSRDIPIGEMRAAPALLLPIMEDREGLFLWGRNWWGDIWSKADLENSLSPLLLPLGDIADTSEASAIDVLSGNRLAIDQLKLRYNVDIVYVVHALADIEGQLGVTVYNYTPDAVDVDVLSYVGQDPHAYYGEIAVNEIIDKVTESWKLKTVIGSDSRTQLVTQVAFSGFNEWKSITDRLSATSLIRDVKIKELSRSFAVVSFSFIGSVDQVRTNLLQSGLSLTSAFQGYRLEVVN